MDKLTDEQLKTLGAAIGAEIVRAFSAKQEYWGGKGWLSKIAEYFAESLVKKAITEIRSNEYNESFFVSMAKKILGKD